MSTHTRRTKTALALALTVAATVPAAASAQLDPNPSPGPPTTLPQPPVRIIQVTQHEGFDWGDAGIGAAGGFGLSLLAIGGGVVLAQRRGHGARGHAAPAS